MNTKKNAVAAKRFFSMEGCGKGAARVQLFATRAHSLHIFGSCEPAAERLKLKTT